MSKKSGNVLFLILIAVALFAALSYAVTSTSRSGESGISKDKAKIAAAQIVQYATQLEQIITRLRVINKCADTQISFERSPFDGSDTPYVNANAPSDFRCHVFHPSGGGGQFKTKFNNIEDDLAVAFSSVNRIHSVNEGPAPHTAAEWDLAVYMSDIGVEICRIINKKEGMLLDGFAEDNMPGGAFDGTYTVRNSTPDNGETVVGAKLDFATHSKGTGCYKLVADEKYIFVHTLIMRVD